MCQKIKYFWSFKPTFTPEVLSLIACLAFTTYSFVDVWTVDFLLKLILIEIHSCVLVMHNNTFHHFATFSKYLSPCWVSSVLQEPLEVTIQHPFPILLDSISKIVLDSISKIVDLSHYRIPFLDVSSLFSGLKYKCHILICVLFTSTTNNNNYLFWRNVLFKEKNIFFMGFFVCFGLKTT